MIVIPGIMGSELADAESGRLLWGLSDPRWYISAWTSGAALTELRLSAEERAGRYGRVRATQLLRAPAFAPMLAGLSPYHALEKSLRDVVWHPRALTGFAYDWRLPVAHNATLLADFARRHLADWLDHPAYQARQAELPRTWAGQDSDPAARLVLIAHSMGGLLAWLACQDPDVARLVRATVTLGTPFYGAPKAVMMLGSGRGARLPHRRVRQLAVTLPGIYDLLPAYRCVADGKSARRLTVADVVSLGGDPELAAGSLALAQARPALPPAGHVLIVGAHQPTIQSVAVSAGAVTAHQFGYRPSGTGTAQVDAGGDGTVPRDSAQLPDELAMPLAQTHGAVAAAAEAVLIVQDVVTAQPTGPLLGAGEIGLDAPDVVQAGQTFQFRITGIELPTDVRCTVLDIGSGLQVDAPAAGWCDGAIVAPGQPLPPGLYQIRVNGGSTSPVTQLLLSADLAGPGAGDPGQLNAADDDRPQDAG